MCKTETCHGCRFATLKLPPSGAVHVYKWHIWNLEIYLNQWLTRGVETGYLDSTERSMGELNFSPNRTWFQGKDYCIIVSKMSLMRNSWCRWIRIPCFVVAVEEHLVYQNRRSINHWKLYDLRDQRCQSKPVKKGLSRKTQEVTVKNHSL